MSNCEECANVTSSAQYQQCIPKCCLYATYTEHLHSLGLCWSITSGKVNKSNNSACDDCELNLNNEEIL